MNPMTIPNSPGSTTTGTALSGATAAQPPSNRTSGALFSAQLGDSLAALFKGVQSSTQSSASGDSTSVDAGLERTLKELLDRGTSLADLIARLAGSLATSVAAQLGISPQAAQERLTQAFTRALQPNDTGPPGTNAERASSLVSRLRRIAELATGVTNGDTGHTIRLIAGQRSDAGTAKASPAPQPDSILRDALAALAVPASPVPDATTVASAVPVAPAASSDGRTVAIPETAQAIATAGDTPLGRILARAVLADETRPTPVAGPIIGATHHLTDPPSAGVTPPGGIGAAAGGALLDAFLQSFAAALARSDAAAASPAHSDPNASGPSGPAPISGSATAATQPALPFALAFSPPAPVAPVVTAPTPPHEQHVDANAVVDQLLRGMAVRTADGQSEVRLRLVPEQLGDVSVKLIVSGGSVDASITAHTAEAQNALAGGQTQLAKTLADAGLKLQSFTVALAGGSFADARDQSRQNDPWTRSSSRRIGGLRSVDVEGTDDGTLLAIPSFGPPIYAANPARGALNYLV